MNTVRPKRASGRVNGRSFSILRHNMVMELSPTYANDDDYDVICYVGMARGAHTHESMLLQRKHNNHAVITIKQLE